MARVDRLWMVSRKIYRLFLMNIFLNGTIEPSLKMHKLFIFCSLADSLEKMFSATREKKVVGIWLDHN
jgi:hypothetical protein